MITWFKSLLYDPQSFANFIRFAVFAGGELTATLGPSAKFWWAGKALQAAAVLIKAGDKNLPAVVP